MLRLYLAKSVPALVLEKLTGRDQNAINQATRRIDVRVNRSACTLLIHQIGRDRYVSPRSSSPESTLDLLSSPFESPPIPIRRSISILASSAAAPQSRTRSLPQLSQRRLAPVMLSNSRPHKHENTNTECIRMATP